MEFMKKALILGLKRMCKENNINPCTLLNEVFEVNLGERSEQLRVTNEIIKALKKELK